MQRRNFLKGSMFGSILTGLNIFPTLDARPQTLEKNVNNPKQRSFPTGSPEFDKATGGLQAGCLHVILGRSGSGKTTFAKQIYNANRPHSLFCTYPGNNLIIPKSVLVIDSDDWKYASPSLESIRVCAKKHDIAIVITANCNREGISNQELHYIADAVWLVDWRFIHQVKNRLKSPLKIRR